MVGDATGDMGIGKGGAQTSRFQRGMELHAKYAFFAEGVRGNLGKELQENSNSARTRPAGLWHRIEGTVGSQTDRHVPAWCCIRPAGRCSDTYGGSFLYHMENNLVAVRFVGGWRYTNPYFRPEEFQRYKTTRPFAPFPEAASASPMGHAPSTRGICNRCRN